MNKRKAKGEAYIDVVIGLFLSMMVLSLSINLYNFFNAYHKQVYLTEQMVRAATMEGNTRSAEVGERYAGLVKETGLGVSDSAGYAKTKNLAISFDGSELVDDDSDYNGTVQLGRKIQVSTTMNIPIKLINSQKTITIPTSVTKSGLSEQYWKPYNAAEDSDRPGNGQITGGDSGDQEPARSTIRLNKTKLVIEKGNHDSLSAIVTSTNMQDPTVSWASSDENIATVDSLGTVYGINIGTTAVTATTSTGERATCTVEVIAPTIPVQSINVAPEEMNLTVGQSQQATAVITPGNATDKTVTWKSENVDIASVSSTGLITGRSAGSVHITATASNGARASVFVTVTNPIVSVSKVSLNTHHLDMYVGDNQQLTADIIPENATDKQLVWESNDVAATVSSDGLITAQSEGNCTITVRTTNGESDSCTVTVKPKYVKVSDILLLPANPTMYVDDTATFTARIYPADATNKEVTWSSSNTEVGEIDSEGKFTALSVGKTDITVAGADGVKTTTTVTVKTREINPTGISVSPSSMILTPGQTGKLTATVTPVGATDKSVSYIANDSSTATVTDDGTVTGVKAGSTFVTAKTVNGKTAVCQVTVKEPTTGIELNTLNISMLPGNSQKLYARNIPGGESPEKLTWKSSDNSVATVGADGTVTAVKVGQADITATSGKFSATCHIRILVTRLEISDKSISLYADQTKQLSVTVDPSVPCTWSSSNSNIAAVDQTGLVKAQHLGGTAVVTVTAPDGTEATCNVTVIHHNVTAHIGFSNGQEDPSGSVTAKLNSISINETAATLQVSETKKLTVTTNPSAVCKWSSSDNSIATVGQDGTVNAVSPGEVTVKAEAADGSYVTCKISVVATLDLNRTQFKILKGSSYQLVPEDPSEISGIIDWASTNPSVASVDSNGNITAQNTGTTVIKANAKNSSSQDIYAACSVTVVNTVHFTSSYADGIDSPGVYAARSVPNDDYSVGYVYSVEGYSSAEYLHFDAIVTVNEMKIQYWKVLNCSDEYNPDCFVAAYDSTIPFHYYDSDVTFNEHMVSDDQPISEFTSTNKNIDVIGFLTQTTYMSQHVSGEIYTELYVGQITFNHGDIVPIYDGVE